MTSAAREAISCRHADRSLRACSSHQHGKQDAPRYKVLQSTSHHLHLVTSNIKWLNFTLLRPDHLTVSIVQFVSGIHSHDFAANRPNQKWAGDISYAGFRMRNYPVTPNHMASWHTLPNGKPVAQIFFKRRIHIWSPQSNLPPTLFKRDPR